MTKKIKIINQEEAEIKHARLHGGKQEATIKHGHLFLKSYGETTTKEGKHISFSDIPDPTKDKEKIKDLGNSCVEMPCGIIKEMKKTNTDFK